MKKLDQTLMIPVAKLGHCTNDGCKTHSKKNDWKEKTVWAIKYQQYLVKWWKVNGWMDRWMDGSINMFCKFNSILARFG